MSLWCSSSIYAAITPGMSKRAPSDLTYPKANYLKYCAVPKLRIRREPPHGVGEGCRFPRSGWAEHETGAQETLAELEVYF